MAIMQEETETVMSSSGFNKIVEASAQEMMMNHMQKGQYMYPHKSAVRELVCNGLDSVKEKNVAVGILINGKSIEDYYITRDDPRYADSNFDPTYYDPKWLSDKNTVIITYEDGGSVDKDRVIITDYGVGLGGKRLYKYFMPGFSTKRNNKFTLGKWGLGAKSALSVAPFYFMTSRYNGMEFKFQVFLHNVQPVVPSFNMETGKPNPYIEFLDEETGNMSRAHYLPTTELNGVVIELQAKKNHKQIYIDAVKSQLMYFQNIEFRIKPNNGPYIIQPTKATIMYEDETMILSDGNSMSKPHILINGVNYGVIDFQELELQEMNGNIGVKVLAEEVEVSPSREFVIWSDFTKEAIKAAFGRVLDKAGELVSKELLQPNFMQWLKACLSVNSYFGHSNTVVGRLAGIVDMKEVKPRYAPDPRIVFGVGIFPSISPVKITWETETEKGKKIKKIVRNPVYGTSLHEMPLVVRNGSASARKSKYIISTMFTNGYIETKVDPSKVFDSHKDSLKLIVEYMGGKPEIVMRGGKHYKYFDIDSPANVALISEYGKLVIGYMLEDKAQYTVFEDIVVPDDFKANEDDEEEIVEDTVKAKAEAKEAFESARERRKKQGKTILFTPRSITYEPSHAAGDPPPRYLEMHKIEVPYSMIDNWKTQEIFFGNKEHDSLIHLAAMMTRPAASKFIDFQIPRPKEMFMSERINKYRHNPLSDLRDNYSMTPVGQTGTGWQINPDYRPEVAIGTELNADSFRACWFYQNDEIKLLQVAKENMKYYRDFKHILQFYMDMQGKTLTMSNALIRWNTARVIHKKFEQLKFLNNFGSLNKDMADKFKMLNDFMTAYWKPIADKTDKFFGGTSDEYNQVVSYLDKVFQFQQIVQETDDKEALGKLAVEWFNPTPGVVIEDACAVDMKYYSIFTELVDYAEPIKGMLNFVQWLTTSNSPLPEELEKEIRFYCEQKQVDLL